MEDHRFSADVKHFDSLPTPEEPLVARVRREQRNRKGVLYYRAHDCRPEELPKNFRCEHPGCNRQLSFDPCSYRAVIRKNTFADGSERVIGIEDHGLCPDGHINHIFDENDIVYFCHDSRFSSIEVRAETVSEMMPEEAEVALSRLLRMGELTVQLLQDW